MTIYADLGCVIDQAARTSRRYIIPFFISRLVLLVRIDKQTFDKKVTLLSWLAHVDRGASYKHQT